MRRILRAILVVLTMLIAVPYIQIIANTPIKVIVDQQQLVLDQPPVLEDGRVFVPLRSIFESLGAKIKWDPTTQIIMGEKHDTLIILEIDKREALINNKKILMDVPSKIINGRIMVPIKFVAKNLGIKISWDIKNQSVVMTTPCEDEILKYINKNIEPYMTQKDFTIYKNNDYPDNYVEIKILGNNKIEIKGRTLTNNRYMLVEVIGVNGKEYINNQTQIKSDGTFQETYTLNLESGKYNINIFMNKEEYGTYEGIHTDISICKSEKEMIFEKSSIYKINAEYRDKNNKVLLADLSLSGFSKEDKSKLLQLAMNITKDSSTAYDKVLAISEWVSENIYYDYDALNSGKLEKIDAIGTLEQRRSVCQGYSSLTEALVRSIGIPTKLVYGHTLAYNSSGMSWGQVDHTKPNHVWNEVFLDGRWIIIDTTWNSKNRYEKGKYVKIDKTYAYFDITTEALSNTHRITDR